MEVRGDPEDFMPIYTNLDEGPLLAAIDNVKTELQNNKIVPEHVKRNQIPKYYIRKHKVQTLYRVELPHYWRLIYTLLTFEDGEQGALLMEVFDHDAYNKRFGYK